MGKHKLDGTTHDCTANHRLGKQCYPSMQCSKILPLKDPAEVQKDEEGEGETSLVPNLEPLVNHWTSQARATRDFSGSSAQAISTHIEHLKVRAAAEQGTGHPSRR